MPSQAHDNSISASGRKMTPLCPEASREGHRYERNKNILHHNLHVLVFSPLWKIDKLCVSNMPQSRTLPTALWTADGLTSTARQFKPSKIVVGAWLDNLRSTVRARTSRVERNPLARRQAVSARKEPTANLPLQDLN